MLLGTLCVRLLENLLTGKEAKKLNIREDVMGRGVMRAGEGKVKTGEGTIRAGEGTIRVGRIFNAASFFVLIFKYKNNIKTNLDLMGFIQEIL